PNLPAQLRPVVARLKSGTPEERAKAAEELANLGEKAQPAARALCEAALSPSQKVSRGALEALKKVHPDLHEPVFVLLIDEKAENHQQALAKLSLLGDQGKPAVPVLLHQIKKCQELLAGERARWQRQELIDVTVLNAQTLVKVAQEEPVAAKTLVDLTTFTLKTQVAVRGKHRFHATKTPFRDEGVRLLGELAEAHVKHRKQI